MSWDSTETEMSFEPTLVSGVDNTITIYLSGPMTGLPLFNAAEFAKYAETYRSLGFRVINPAELDTPEEKENGEYVEFIRRDLKLFLEENIDRVYVLPGWRESRGASFEVYLAEMLSIPIYDATTGLFWVESVTEEAHRLVHSDRGASYSHPLDDFGRTAKIVSALLGTPITEEQIALIQIAVKLSRLVASPDHRDSVVDVAGYAECYRMVREERERRASDADAETE